MDPALTTATGALGRFRWRDVARVLKQRRACNDNALAAVQEPISQALRQADPDQPKPTRELVQMALDSRSQAYETGTDIGEVIDPRPDTTGAGLGKQVTL
jgi:hypothetical protein